MAPTNGEGRSRRASRIGHKGSRATHPQLYHTVDKLCTTSACLAMDLGQLARRYDDRTLVVAALGAVDVAIGVHRFMARLVDGQVAP